MMNRTRVVIGKNKKKIASVKEDELQKEDFEYFKNEILEGLLSESEARRFWGMTGTFSKIRERRLLNKYLLKEKRSHSS